MFIDTDETLSMQEPPELDGQFDSIGGYHTEGTGYDPLGMFCGECINTTCEFCPQWMKVKTRAALLLEADKCGQVLILPCLPGVRVWFLEGNKVASGEVWQYGYEDHLWASISISKSKVLLVSAKSLFLSEAAANCAAELADRISGVTPGEAEDILQMRQKGIEEEDIIAILSSIRKAKEKKPIER